MTAIDNKLIEFKIVPVDSNYVIGSNSNLTQGDFYTVNIEMKLLNKNTLRSKRILDILISSVFICLLPELLIAKYNMPFYFGGTSLLIVVSVTMDTVAQVHSHMIAHQYEGLIKKTKLRGRNRSNRR